MGLPRLTPSRVVSLVPSLTETLFAIGAGESVVGITDWCIFPAGLALPRVGGTKNPHIDAIRALEPDLVYVNIEENLKRHADEIAQFTRVVATEPKTIDDVRELFTMLGAIHQRDAAPLLASLQRELDAMPKRAFTFAVPIWKKPWMVRRRHVRLASRRGRRRHERPRRASALSVDRIERGARARARRDLSSR